MRHDKQLSLSGSRSRSKLLLLAALIGSMVATTLFPTMGASAAVPKIFEKIDLLDRFGNDARAALGAGYVPEWPAECSEEGSTGFCPLPFGGSFGSAQDFSGTIIVIPHARQIWQFYRAPSFSQGTGVVIRNLDTLAVVKGLILPGTAKEAGSSDGDWSHAVDEVHNRLFVISSNSLQVFEIDLETFGMKTRPLPSLEGFFPSPPAGTAVGGIAYDPFRDDLLLLYGGPGFSSAGNTNTYLYPLDLNAQQDAKADIAKVFKIQSCTGPVTSTDAGGTTAEWEILVAEDYLWVPCQRAGHIGIVVRMRRPGPDNPFPQEDYIAGPNYASLALADQRARRLFMISSQGEMWVFDADTLSFLGVVATTDTQPIQGDNPGSGETSWGLDSDTGRYFYQNNRTGLGVVEGRFFPVPQALIDRERKSKGRHRIYSDAVTNRIFVLEGDWNYTKPRHYKIYRVFPAPVPPPPPNPDLNTTNVEEQAGVTESRFFSRGSGYGFRTIWAGGWAKVIPAPPLGVLCPTCPINQGFGNARNGHVDRELYLGRVFQAEYDTGSTSASAIGLGTDQFTRQDFGLKSNPAACSSSEGGEPEFGVGQPAEMGRSTVTCPVPGGELRAFGEGRLDGNVSVGKAWTEVLITKINRGVLSQSTAVAQDIVVGGIIHIGEVRSTAVSLSNGRPSRKDMSTHTVAIKGVRIGDNLVCNQCTDNEAVVRALTTAGGPLRMQFRVGTQDVSGLDLALLRGSPGGALTAVQKSDARQSQDRALVADTTTDVPGLEITVFNDNVTWGRARQIYQFAGVSTVANYNIVLLPQSEEFPGDDGSGFGDDSGSFDDSGDGFPFGDEFALTSDAEDSGALGTFASSRNPIVRAIGAVARGLRFFFSDPRHFMLLLTAWALFSLPPFLARRRNLLRVARAA